ncbi:MAG: hypothetical protein AAB420_02745 [Patescibacteria group bacterium]
MSPNTQAPGPHWKRLLIPLVILVPLVVGYGVLAKNYNWWPHQASNQTPSTSSVDTNIDGNEDFGDTYLKYSDNGTVLDLYDGTRFGFNLDIARYPLKNIKIACSDYASIGHISNWSLRGPDNYPIGYEVSGNGTCTWQNGDYKVTITTRSN